MESHLLEISRDLMTYKRKIQYSAKMQKVLTKFAWALEKWCSPGGGNEHPAMGSGTATILGGVRARSLLGQYLPSLLNVCSIKNWFLVYAVSCFTAPDRQRWDYKVFCTGVVMRPWSVPKELLGLWLNNTLDSHAFLLPGCLVTPYLLLVS